MRGFAGAIEAIGYSSQRFSTVDRTYETSGEHLIPLHVSRSRRCLISEAPADIAVYDELGLASQPPDRRYSRRNVVVFHALLEGSGTWIDNPNLDLYLGNSPYIGAVLQSLLGFPDLTARTLIDPRAFGIVDSIRLALPVVEYPEGDVGMMGADVPARTLERVLESETQVGHALQPGKGDWVAIGSIMLGLNAMAREFGQPPYRLVVSNDDMQVIRRVVHERGALDPRSAVAPPVVDALIGELARLELTLDDIFIAVPYLNHPALMQLLQSTSFCLAYNRVPEAFGFYLLESVFQGCPVFTNGVGNNRHLLPDHHGIEIFETVEMSRNEPSAYASLVRRIFGRAERRLEEDCERGRELIMGNYSRRTLEADLARTLGGVDDAPPEYQLADLRFAWSPLVRQVQREMGWVVSDYKHAQLELTDMRLAENLIGESPLVVSHSSATRGAAQRLVDLGILTVVARPGPLHAPCIISPG